MTDRIWVLDLETYFTTERGNSYTLTKMSTVDYVTDPRWKVHGMAVIDPYNESAFADPTEIPLILAEIKPDDIVLAHNWLFDGFALKHHYGFKHWKVVCTKLLANAVLGPAKDRGHKNKLEDLAQELGFPAKSKLDPLDGVRDPSPEQWDYLALYAKQDARLCRSIYDELRPRLTRAGFELWLMRHSLECFINRPIAVDVDQVDMAERIALLHKREVLDKVIPLLVDDEVRLSSSPQFAGILVPMLEANGLKLPMKQSPRTKKMIPALAKKDEGLRELRHCGIPDVENLIEARLVTKSIATVLARLNGLKNRERTHLNLVYCGAHTGRWAGGGD